MSGILQGAAPDFVLMIVIIAIIACLDIVPSALRRRRQGGPLLQWSDITQRRYILILLPFILVVALQQSIFSALGFQAREDVPYVIGFMVVVALAAVALVWWSKRKT